MQVAGIIAEYNPLHGGHLYQIARTKALWEPGCAVICAMSGNFTQRGDFALVRKHVRAEAAVRSGADLVVELPLPWAVSSAEQFADGGVQVLAGTGLVTHLSFGSECGDARALQRAAKVLLTPEFSAALKEELTAGDSFPAARQRVARRFLSPENAALLSDPNNLLGVEYCKALLHRKLPVTPVTVQRTGMAHHGVEGADGPFSAGAIREALRQGNDDLALREMAPAMAELYQREKIAGRAPVFTENCRQAMLYRLRCMTEEDFARLDSGKEGLYHRLYDASRTAASPEKILAAAKTKRYAYTRLSRMMLWAYLGLQPEDFLAKVPYLRVLAANETGRALLAQMRTTASVPVLTKPADVRKLSAQAQHLFALEARATDLYALAYPDIAAACGGLEWREGPVIR
ncbi:MAG: nucleotidyltransferase family protein [Oscillibacter sp.]|nr:nucleotidyltransferase family protein [Oscillibacter sp.]